MRRPSRKRTSRRATRRPLRVAVVCSHLEIGGQESGILGLLRRFDRTRIRPLLYTFRGGPHLRAIRQLGIPVLIGTPRPGSLDRWTQADSRAKIAFRRQMAAAFRVDRIDVCLIYAWADGITAAREAGVPAIVERVDGPKLIGWVRDKSSCQRIICETEAIRRLLRSQREWLRCKSVPITVVRNAIDLAVFDPVRYSRTRSRRALGLRDDDFVIGTVARLAPVKNLGHLLDAVRLLVDRIGQMPHVRVLIAGPDGGDGQRLRSKARELRLTGQVRFLGARNDVARILRTLDAFVLPSIQEGTPFALLEAMAMGLPVIASQIDSIAELVRDNGFLVGPLDPYRTTTALRTLIQHRGLRLALGRRSAELAAQHGVDAMVRRYERELRAAFAAGRQQPGFRRRIAVVPGHAPLRPGPVRPIDRVFAGLRASKVDAYALTLEALTNAVKWPPSRRQRFPDTSQGRSARATCLEWLNPDVVVTDCPKIVRLARALLPGETIVYVPDVDDPCRGRAQATRLADHIVDGDRTGALDAIRLRALLSRARAGQ